APPGNRGPAAGSRGSAIDLAGEPPGAPGRAPELVAAPSRRRVGQAAWPSRRAPGSRGAAPGARNPCSGAGGRTAQFAGALDGPGAYATSGCEAGAHRGEIGRAHVCTPVTCETRMPSYA